MKKTKKLLQFRQNPCIGRMGQEILRPRVARRPENAEGGLFLNSVLLQTLARTDDQRRWLLETLARSTRFLSECGRRGNLTGMLLLGDILASRLLLSELICATRCGEWRAIGSAVRCARHLVHMAEILEALASESCANPAWLRTMHQDAAQALAQLLARRGASMGRMRRMGPMG